VGARLSAALVSMLLLGGATFAATAAVTAAPAGAQMTDHWVELPGAMDDMVVDAATSHVFVSLPAQNEVVVLDFAGDIVGTISDEAGARGLAMLDGHLYVVAADADAIDEIDTTTLVRTRTVASGLTHMKRLATAANALWAGSSGSLRRIALDGTVTTFTGPPSAYALDVVTDPADSSKLITYSAGISPVTIAMVDVSGAAPVVLHKASPPHMSNVNDIAVSPDGTHLVPVGGAPHEFDEINASDLTATGVVYPANPYPTAAAMTGAGGGLFAGGLNGIMYDDVYLYALDDTSTPIATHEFGVGTTEPRGLHFSPDGSDLFAVAGTRFHVLAVPGVPPSGTGDPDDPGSGDTPPTDPPPTITVTMNPSSLAFGTQRVGTYGLSRNVTVTNDGSEAETLDVFGVAGADPRDFFGTTSCRRGTSLAPGASCHATMYFGALGFGARRASLVVQTADTSASIAMSGTGTEGYYLADSRGGAAGFGDATVLGVAEHALAAPVIAITPTYNGAGFWLLARDGGIFSYGNAAFHGSTGALHLNRPIVGMAATPSGKGYWLVASDGGIFSFGDAKFHGSTGNLRLARPIIGMAATATGRGYEFVANDGGVFSFGDAHFYGSAAKSGAKIVGLAGTPTGRGYWMVSNTGRVFRFGDAPGYGDAVSRGVTDVVGIAGTAPIIPQDLLGTTGRAAASSAVIPLTAHRSTTLIHSP
jgi:hypothetical protein